MELSDEEKKWFVNHFEHTKNAVICAKLGIKLTTMHRLKRELGLKKTKAFMRKTQLEATTAARIAVLNETADKKQRRQENARRNNQKARFKKGVWALRNKTSSELEEISKKRVASWEKSRQADEMRLNWGIETKHHFRFAKVLDPKKQKILLNLRYNMRRLGYVFPKIGSMVAYYNEETKRSSRREATAAKLGMLIKNSI